MKLKQEEEKQKKKGNIGRQIYRVILYAFLYSFGAVASFAAVVLFFDELINANQHVLEPVYAYLYLAAAQLEDMSIAGNYNVGPEESDCLKTIDMAELFCAEWNRAAEEGMKLNRAYVECRPDGGPHEAKLLKLDCTKIKAVLGRKPGWDSAMAVKKTVEWAAAYVSGADVDAVCAAQIEDYMKNLLQS